MDSFQRAIRNHLHFIVVLCALLVVMTWPTIVYVFNKQVFWLPIDSGDIWIEFWNAWYGKLILAGKADPLFTEQSFYPQGLSLAYHNFSLPHVLIFGALQGILPASNAYNLTYLLITIATTAAAYIYLQYLFNDKWTALFGSVIVGFSGYVVGRPMHPGVAFLATVPLSCYFLHRGFAEMRWTFIAMSGILVGATAFISLYIFVCLLIIVGAYFLYFAISQWKVRRFWLMVAAMIAVAGFSGWLRAYPMLSDETDLGGILDKTGGRETENDLLQFFINYENPFFNRLITNRVTSSIVLLPDPGRWNTSYLGYVPLLLIGLGLIRKNYRRRMMPWLLLLMPFFLLRLGSVLTINGQVIDSVVLPKYALDRLAPVVFEAFYSTDHFQIGLLLPLAVTSCYGLLALLDRFPMRRRGGVVLLLIALLAAEYYRSPPGGHIVLEEELAFLDWLAEESDEPVRLINLPMNRGNSKQYLFYQTLSGYPQVEGLATRTPPSAYDYIKANPILNAWHRSEGLICTEENRDNYLAAVAQLRDDGFSHLVLHYSLLKPDTIEGSFFGLEPAYEDEFVAIYRLAILPEACQ
ncbi:MAG: hypothetical protein OXN94_02470 [Chloroflexota bacterium]|nr:hypothetical protein [Chloroflexota bacterium]